MTPPANPSALPDGLKIPPNCPFLSPHVVDGACWFRHYGALIGFDIHLGTGHAMSVRADDKPIIACVAAQYWRMEAERQREIQSNIATEDITPEQMHALAETHWQLGRWLRWGGLQ